MLFAPPQYVLSDNDLNLYCKSVQDIARRFNIQWKCTSIYNPQGNGVVGRMVGSLKKTVQKFTRSESKEWDASRKNIFHRYRHRSGADRVAPFEILFGFKPSFAIESPGAIPEEEVLANAWPFERAMALVNRAERFVPRTFQKDARCQFGDRVLLRRGN